jgi:phenylpyruvate tautomerase PptA (4-oxalocrotonate tautomerase family)
MCVVRVTLRRGRTPGQLATLSTAIDDALVQAYDMDAHDTFQIFEQKEAGEFVYDRHYKSEDGRSDDFLLLSIVGGPKNDDLKRAFYQRLVELLGERAGVRPDDVFVSLQEAPAVSWSFGRGVPLG